MAISLVENMKAEWFEFALRKTRGPTMIAMPSLPAVNLSESLKACFPSRVLQVDYKLAFIT